MTHVKRPGSHKYVGPNNFGLGKRNRSNIWRYPSPTAFGRDKDANQHPTPKPIAMMEDAIIDLSNPGDLVLDPFCGSGTTLLAAHRTGRRGVGIEIDPLYVDLALRRLAKATGETPLLSDGRTFVQVASDRAKETGDD